MQQLRFVVSACEKRMGATIPLHVGEAGRARAPLEMDEDWRAAGPTAAVATTTVDGHLADNATNRYDSNAVAADAALTALRFPRPQRAAAQRYGLRRARCTDS